MVDCIFCKIKAGEIPAKILYQDDDVMAFPDVHPAKPVHILIIPKKHVKEFVEVDDPMLFAKIGHAIQLMIREHRLEKGGYRITINGGGAQEVDHLHVHLMGPIGSKVKM